MSFIRVVIMTVSGENCAENKFCLRKNIIIHNNIFSSYHVVRLNNVSAAVVCALKFVYAYVFTCEIG